MYLGQEAKYSHMTATEKHLNTQFVDLWGTQISIKVINSWNDEHINENAIIYVSKQQKLTCDIHTLYDKDNQNVFLRWFG